MTTLEGMQAPEFTLPNEKGEMVSLKDFAGEKYVVLYFYPKDSTPGCTTQACDFRDAYEDFSKLNAVYLGSVRIMKLHMRNSLENMDCHFHF